MKQAKAISIPVDPITKLVKATEMKMNYSIRSSISPFFEKFNVYTIINNIYTQ